MPTPIHRIIHIDNLEYILQSGLIVAPNHPQADQNYIQIGNNNIINQRNARGLPFNPDRTFRDYVGFHFGPRSIMMYNIHTGREVTEYHQRNIIYLISNAELIVHQGLEFFFTDGNGTQIPNTRVFQDWKDLDQVDMAAAYSRHWSNQDEEADPGIKRKKHAEFQVFRQLELNQISEIVVYDQQAFNRVAPLVHLYMPNIQVAINPEQRYYF